MSGHKIVLVHETNKNLDSINSNITLTCPKYSEGNKAYCDGIIDKIGVYYIFVDDKNTTHKIIVYPIPSEILDGNLHYSSDTNFILFIAHNIKYRNVFTLINEFNNNNNVYLNCKLKYYSTGIGTTEYNCTANLTNAGRYYLYSNGVKQKIYIDNPNSYLTKALYIKPNLILFDSESMYVSIFFDSFFDSSSTNVKLKGANNIANLEFSHSYGLEAEFRVQFPAPDTYYVYIDNEKQNVSITVINELKIPKIISIFPNIVDFSSEITFDLTVDSNYGIELVNIWLQNYDTGFSKLYCNADSLDKTKAICSSYHHKEGNNYINIRDVDYKNLNVTVKKNVPMKYNYFPHSVNASTNSQSIVFNFQNDTSNYVNKISFVGIETIQPTCEAMSSVTLNCSAVFNKVGKYYFTIDGVYNGDIIYVRENYKNTQDTQDSQDTQDNKSKENSKSQQNENNENNNSNENSEKK